MNMKEMNVASQYFDEHWKQYLDVISNNTLYHREMMTALDDFLNNHFGAQSFSFVDVGCGDSSTILSVLKDKDLAEYVGIDAAEHVLTFAEKNLEIIHCKKEFIAKNMQEAIRELTSTYDVIFSSYAVHHLSQQEKEAFIAACHDKLNENGYFIMIDGILKPKQTRDQWLHDLGERMMRTLSLNQQQCEDRLHQHARNCDFPEEIAKFNNIAKKQGWTRFEVLFEKDIFACMVFCK